MPHNEDIYIDWLASVESDPERAKHKWSKWRALNREPAKPEDEARFEQMYQRHFPAPTEPQDVGEDVG